MTKRPSLSLRTSRALLQRLFDSATGTPTVLTTVDWCTCLYCGVRLKRNHPADSLTREHILPRAEGGIITMPACITCNRARGRTPMKAFLVSDWIKTRIAAVRTQPDWREPPSIHVMLWLHGAARRHAKSIRSEVTE